MDLYFAGVAGAMQEYATNLNYNVLFSYLNDKKSIENWISFHNKNSKLFIDSGAFTAWTKGKDINVDEYIDWINERAEYINLYGQVDCIPGHIKYGATREQVEQAAEKTWQNYLYMRPKMKNPDGLLYTFHVGEPYEYLKQALEWKDENGNSISYIALGGMVGKSLPVKEQFLNLCFDIIKNSSNPNVKVHAFGLTTYGLLERYPITSADSTRWIKYSINGLILTKFGTIDISSKRFGKNNALYNIGKDILLNELQFYGFTIEELSQSIDTRCKYNMVYMSEVAHKLSYIKQPQIYKLF